MIDLSSGVGIEVKMNDEFRLDFGRGVEYDKFSTRSQLDLLKVVADDSLALKDEPAYYMYRNVRAAGDEKKLNDKKLRFDLTVIPAGKLGNEFVKTSGHYHPKKPGTAYTYPELYYVLSGQATYLMQKKSTEEQIEDVIICRVTAGRAIIMPCDYGHVTINELAEPLVMANWVEATFQSDYSEYEALRGACYYIMSNFGLLKVEVNKKYIAPPEPRKLKAKPQVLEAVANEPIYNYFDRGVLDFLTELKDYYNKITVDKLFSV